jgi:iron complex outermembrane recepter protein
MVWGAVSRALRTPDDTDESIRVNLQTLPNPDGPPLLLALLGNRQSQDEDLIAYEIGYRSEISHWASVDLATYFNNYTNLQTTEPGVPFFESSPAPPHLVVPLIFHNLMYGQIGGVEIAAHWKVIDRWTLSPGYAFEEIHMHLRPASQDTSSVAGAEGSTPESSAQLRSQVLIRHDVSWNTSAYFSGRLTDPVEAAYTRLDSGLLWQFAERSSLGVVGQNLLRDHHTECADATGSVQTTLIKRSVFAQFIFRF